MADGFIVRKGGVTTEQALAPTITEVSTTTDSITFTIKNNDTASATIAFRVSSVTASGQTLTLAADTTSSNLTVSGLADDTTFTVFATANVTSKIKSDVAEEEITTDEIKVFTAATGGTTLEYDSGGKRFKSHTFTSNGNFVVSTVGDNVDDRNKVDYLIIAGGGAGSDYGAGGAGGFRTTVTPVPSDESPNAKVTVTAATFGITVGSGGTGGKIGQNGANSSVAFAQTITSTGGGYGSYNQGPGRQSNGEPGGSGGGGLWGTNVSSQPVGSGGNGILGQGRNGGNGFNQGSASSPFATGGGGGAGQVGQNGTSTIGGPGGNGLANNLRTGSNETRAGGGGGAHFNGSGGNASGGTGGGGTGGKSNSGQTAGTVNTGSGGGGAGNSASNGSNGGSGIVVIRYEIAPSV